MPHYRNGMKARIGDHVRGKTYNQPHEITGVVVSVTPGTESCNCRVAFARPVLRFEEPTAHLVGGVMPNHGGIHVPVKVETDYSETRNFELIERSRLLLDDMGDDEIRADAALNGITLPESLSGAALRDEYVHIAPTDGT